MGVNLNKQRTQQMTHNINVFDYDILFLQIIFSNWGSFWN
jgi:hypothetical protein